MKNNEFEKSITHQLVDTVDYVQGSVIIKSILNKKTGMVTISSFDTGEAMLSKSSPFDSLIQIIDGEAEITIDEKSNMVEAGQAIIIPAHAQNRIKANKRFKMLSTVVKSGYEDVNL
ncbi:MAG: cupin domain-containing protein [Flavobacteriaceae bacterium]|nr:cupin domain-containing protein [Flavobacteriaceae bacterium]